MGSCFKTGRLKHAASSGGGGGCEGGGGRGGGAALKRRLVEDEESSQAKVEVEARKDRRQQVGWDWGSEGACLKPILVLLLETKRSLPAAWSSASLNPERIVHFQKDAYFNV